MATVRSAAESTVVAGRDVPRSVLDRLKDLRDRMIMHPEFVSRVARLPLIGAFARQRSRTVFDLVAGFTYTQAVAAMVRTRLLEFAADGPQTAEGLGARLGLPEEGARRLVRAGLALDLLESRSRGRVGLGQLGAALLANPAALRMIEHNELVYRAIADPVAVLRGEETEVAGFFSYAESEHPEQLAMSDVAPYSELMAGTLGPLVTEIFDSGELATRRHVLDVGGGEGVFVAAAARQYPSLQVTLFDLPAVVERARARLAASQLDGRVRAVGGTFHQDARPEGADTITLIRVLLDHNDDAAQALLRKVRRALGPGGKVVVAEPMAGVHGAERVGEVYFGFFLRALGQGRTRTPAEHAAFLREAGFARTRLVPTRYPVSTSIIVGEV